MKWGMSWLASGWMFLLIGCYIVGTHLFRDGLGKPLNVLIPNWIIADVLYGTGGLVLRHWHRVMSQDERRHDDDS